MRNRKESVVTGESPRLRMSNTRVTGMPFLGSVTNVTSESVRSNERAAVEGRVLRSRMMQRMTEEILVRQFIDVRMVEEVYK